MSSSHLVCESDRLPAQCDVRPGVVLTEWTVGNSLFHTAVCYLRDGAHHPHLPGLSPGAEQRPQDRAVAVDGEARAAPVTTAAQDCLSGKRLNKSNTI